MTLDSRIRSLFKSPHPKSEASKIDMGQAVTHLPLVTGLLWIFADDLEAFSFD